MRLCGKTVHRSGRDGASLVKCSSGIFHKLQDYLIQYGWAVFGRRSSIYR